MDAATLRDLSRRLSTRRYREVPVETSEGVITFRVRNLSALELMECQLASQDITDPNSITPDYMARLVAWSLVNEQNEAIFANEEGVQGVSQWDFYVVKSLFDVVAEHNYLSRKNLITP